MQADKPESPLAAIFSRGALDASDALTRWLGRPLRVSIGGVRRVDMDEAADVLGPGEALVAACPMELSGGLTGQLILVFEDRSGLATVDLLLKQPIGSTRSWGELEQSAAKETANIVGCAYLNSLAAHLPEGMTDAATAGGRIVPGPPGFRHEFAASLLEFALMDQASTSDRLLVVNSTFSTEESHLDWSLLFVPSGTSLETLDRLNLAI